MDGLETCESLGIRVQSIALPLVTLPVEAGFLPTVLSSTAAADGMTARDSCPSVPAAVGAAMTYDDAARSQEVGDRDTRFPAVAAA